ncbi:MAG TPA: PH domain-containing protein [Candidatus Saccharimonadales bacterium]|nr:PH domain-containing protein [Candidatus Saccharimonadales bacterium]
MLRSSHLPFITYGRAGFEALAPITAVRHYSQTSPRQQRQRAINRLRAAGLKSFAQMQPEGRYLALALHANEHIKALIRGHHDGNHTLLAATNQRIMIIEHRLQSVQSRELTYDLVHGISCVASSTGTGVILQTQLGDFIVGRVPPEQASRLCTYIEQRRLHDTPAK